MELQKTKDISYALKTIEGHFPAAFRPVAASPRQAEPQATGYRQVRIDPLTNPVLLGYLKERGILPEIAREACKEVHFQNKGKWYFAVHPLSRKAVCAAPRPAYHRADGGG